MKNTNIKLNVITKGSRAFKSFIKENDTIDLVGAGIVVTVILPLLTFICMNMEHAQYNF